MKPSRKLLIFSLSMLMLFSLGCPKKPPTPGPPTPGPATQTSVPPPVQPAVTKLVLEGGDKLNSDDNGIPHSVEVRIYQLKSKDRFERATWDELWNQEKNTLAEEVVERQEKTLYPNTPLTPDFHRN